MDFCTVIENRKSIKKFKNTPVDKNKLDRMINAAMMSPSWKNHTSYKFIIVDDKNEKESISKAVINSTDEAAKAISEAPVIAVVVAEPDASGNVNDKDLYLVDSAIAMEHFILAATNEGYGSCWIAALDENKVRSILGVPSNFRVVALTPIGETDECKEHNPKKDIKDYVFSNQWNKSYTH